MKAFAHIAFFFLVCLCQTVLAQSLEDQNTCLTTMDDPCLRTGDCNIQGATWYQEVTVDRADLSDTMGWPGLCDMVHVALVQGRRVRTLVDGYLPAGVNSVTWNGRDNDGVRVPSGLYFLRLQSGALMQSKRIAVLR